MDRFFHVTEKGSTIRTEIMAGITTFMAMAYILMVNAGMFSNPFGDGTDVLGVSYGAIYVATAISAVVGTLLIGLLSNLPLAQASGMGLNAYFVYTVCVGLGLSYANALVLVLFDGIIFVLLTVTGLRKIIFDSIPHEVKVAISAGIGLFIVIVGLKGAGIVVADPSTILAMGDIATPSVALAFIGLIAVAVMYHYKVPGYILWGILLTWILGMIAQACGWYVVDPAAGANSLFPDFSNGIGISAPYLFAFNFDYISSHLVEFAVIVFAFLFVDLFDTAGTVIGVANKGGMLDENGDLPRAKQVLLADAVGTVVGSCLGTSTVTSFVESSAGVAAGGRTGLASVATGVLFLVALVLAPIFLAIPSFATTPALVFVGFLMMSSVKDMDWSEDSAAAVGGFLAIIMMPFTYSIANGIMFGILAFVVIRIFQGRVKEVHWVMWVSTALFVLRIITLVV